MSEIGVIGQTYEDRRNKRIGKLVSRDEKCKTLMFLAPSGKHFMTSYSGFRSNMRKVDVEVSVEISDDVPETESNETEGTVEETAKKPSKKRDIDNPFSEPTAMFKDMLQKLTEYVATFNNGRLKLDVKPEKKNITISLEKHIGIVNMNTVWRDKQVRVFLKESDYLNRKWNVTFDAVYTHITYTRPICVYIPYEQFDMLLEDLKPVIVDALVEKSKSRDMKEEI